MSDNTPLQDNVTKSDTSTDEQQENNENVGPSKEQESSGSSEEGQKPDDEKQPDPGPWQAVYSPQHNAYYFYNSETHETTWNNPLQPSSSDSNTPADASTSDASSSYNALHAAAIAAGIDPSLAHLDPTLAASVAGASDPYAATPGLGPTFTAKFNARTGAFTPASGRDPTHLSEYERMKRMSEFYFDVNQWEQDVAQRDAEEKEGGKKRKRPTKKDLERFKEQKRLKKIAKTAWLRQ